MEVEFVYPHATKTFSVTGNKCALNCAHCAGHYLRQMAPIEELTEKLAYAKQSKFESLLISGGCDSDGRVPIWDYLPLLVKLRKRWRVNIHSGLVSWAEASQLTSAADVVSFNLLGSSQTIKKVLKLDKSSRDYQASYLALKRYVNVVPHICIGLQEDDFSGELNALDFLKNVGACAIVFIVFTPTRGTEYADRSPPEIRRVIELLTLARQQFPNTPIYLGCMRPGGSYREKLDVEALKVGVNKIVMPAPAAELEARKLNFAVKYSCHCCAFFDFKQEGGLSDHTREGGNR